MPRTVTIVLLACMSMYALTIVLELIQSKNVKRLLLEAGAIAAVFVALNLTTGFPRIRVAFGGTPPEAAIALMFVCVLLGIAARYFFRQRAKFSWRSFLKPMCISPMILLPLVGSVEGSSGLQSIQLISFGVLAFQNGFFWEVVLEKAKKDV